MSSGNNKFAVSAFYISVILLWYFLSWTTGSQNFPAPHTVVRAVVQGLIEKDFFFSALSSFFRALFGFMISALAGTAFGIFFSNFQTFDKLSEKFFHTLQIVPNIVWVPVAFVWFGPSELAIFFILFIVGFLSVASYTINGLRTIPANLIDAALTMGEKGIGLYTHIKIPASIPHILTGYKLGWIFVWRSLITAELIYATKGVGLLLNRAKETKNVEEMFAVIVIVFFFGALTEFLFGTVDANIRKKYGLKY